MNKQYKTKISDFIYLGMDRNPYIYRNNTIEMICIQAYGFCGAFVKFGEREVTPVPL